MALHPLRVEILAGRLCADLRTKGMATLGHAGPTPETAIPADTTCFWCNRSGWAMGPDLLPADRERCADPARGCFRTEVEV